MLHTSTFEARGAKTSAPMLRLSGSQILRERSLQAPKSPGVLQASGMSSAIAHRARWVTSESTYNMLLGAS